MNIDNNVRIQVIVNQTTKHGVFNDALYFTPAEYAALDSGALQKLKDDRVAAWVDSVKNPPAPLPEKEILAAEGERIRRDFEQLSKRLQASEAPELAKLKEQIAAAVEVFAEKDLKADEDAEVEVKP